MPLPMKAIALLIGMRPVKLYERIWCIRPACGDLAQPFFDKGWIVWKAQAHLRTPRSQMHPYIMLNYLGKPRDVMTLAHELGHGVHQVLIFADQGEMLSSTPLTLAETASVFGEMLTFRTMLDKAKDQQERKVMFMGKVEDMITALLCDRSRFMISNANCMMRNRGRIDPG